jgi:lipopolysaccharide export system permease protein
MSLLNRHLLRATSGPFIFGFLVATFVLIIDILYRFVELFISKGVPFTMALEVLFLSLGHTFALSIPMAVLIGILMGIGQLAADHEITAMKASGIGLVRILKPLIGGAFVITLSLTAYNHFIFPHSNHRLANLLYDIHHTRPMMEIREQMFTEITPEFTIFVENKNDLTNEIEGVIILQRDGTSNKAPTMTTAERGWLIPLHESDALKIELENGEIHDLPEAKDLSRYNITRFEHHIIYKKNVERDFQDSQRTSRGDREMDLTQLLAAAREQKNNRENAILSNLKTATDLAARQWRLLDPKERLDRITRPGQTEGRIPVNQRRMMLRATHNEIDRVTRSNGFQRSVLLNYEKRENSYMVEFHKKFAIPFACMVFVLLGLPMAVTASRSGKGVSMGVALGVYLVYYLFLVGGEKMADRGRLDPALAMWMANIVLSIFGTFAFVRTVREGSLLPTGWLLSKIRPTKEQNRNETS